MNKINEFQIKHRKGLARFCFFMFVFNMFLALEAKHFRPEVSTQFFISAALFLFSTGMYRKADE